MPRTARKKSATGIYHVMLRGADRRIIFADDEDCERFLETLRQAKNVSSFKIYAYCLMGNHVHLLIEETSEPLEMIFKRIGASYVYYYNWKYELRGHLFQDRFRSETVESDAYFLDVLRYIWQNPVKAGLCKNAIEYPWVGCGSITEDPSLLDDVRQLADMSKDEILSFVGQECEADHLDDAGAKRLTDREAAERIVRICGCRHVQDIGGWETERRDRAVRRALNSGISIRQLSRLTAISKAVIERIGRE